MKKTLRITCAMFLFSFIVSCSIEDPIESTVTQYAKIEYDPFVVVEKGGDFTAEATATENGNSIDVSISGAVNTEEVGIYKIYYSAVNSDGFAATVDQTVVVHDPAVSGTDVTGEIWDKNNHSRTGVITLVEGTNSIFKASDFGFAGTFPVYFQMNNNEIKAIPQMYDFGATDVELAYDPTNREFSVKILPFGYTYTFEYIN